MVNSFILIYILWSIADMSSASSIWSRQIKYTAAVTLSKFIETLYLLTEKNLYSNVETSVIRAKLKSFKDFSMLAREVM